MRALSRQATAMSGMLTYRALSTPWRQYRKYASTMPAKHEIMGRPATRSDVTLRDTLGNAGRPGGAIAEVREGDQDEQPPWDPAHVLGKSRHALSVRTAPHPGHLSRGRRDRPLPSQGRWWPTRDQRQETSPATRAGGGQRRPRARYAAAPQECRRQRIRTDRQRLSGCMSTSRPGR